MFISRRTAAGMWLAILLVWAVRMTAAPSGASGVGEIEAFNKRYVELHLKMDTAGVLALWFRWCRPRDGFPRGTSGKSARRPSRANSSTRARKSQTRLETKDAPRQPARGLCIRLLTNS